MTGFCGTISGAGERQLSRPLTSKTAPLEDANRG